MKTVISGVEVDLLFARVNLPEAGDKLDIEKDEILRGVDDASQRSLNGGSGQHPVSIPLHLFADALLGPRVTDMILNLVPDVATFRTALRTIRLWARSESRVVPAETPIVIYWLLQNAGSTETLSVSPVVWLGLC